MNKNATKNKLIKIYLFSKVFSSKSLEPSFVARHRQDRPRLPRSIDRKTFGQNLQRKCQTESGERKKNSGNCSGPGLAVAAGTFGSPKRSFAEGKAEGLRPSSSQR